MEFKNTIEKQKIVDNTILNAVVELISNSPEVSGNLTKIQKSLYKNISKSNKDFLPKSAASLRVVLNRISNRLKVRGIIVNFDRTKSTRVCTINNCRNK